MLLLHHPLHWGLLFSSTHALWAQFRNILEQVALRVFAVSLGRVEGLKSNKTCEHMGMRFNWEPFGHHLGGDSCPLTTLRFIVEIHSHPSMRSNECFSFFQSTFAWTLNVGWFNMEAKRAQNFESPGSWIKAHLVAQLRGQVQRRPAHEIAAVHVLNQRLRWYVVIRSSGGQISYPPPPPPLKKKENNWTKANNTHTEKQKSMPRAVDKKQVSKRAAT